VTLKEAYTFFNSQPGTKALQQKKTATIITIIITKCERQSEVGALYSEPLAV